MFQIKDIPLFAGLGEAQLAELKAHLIVRHYTKDSIVFYEDEKSEYLHPHKIQYCLSYSV